MIETRKKLWGLGYAILVIGLLVLLGNTRAEQVEERPKVLGIVATPIEDQWGRSMTDSIAALAQECGMEVISIKSEDSQSAQINAIRGLIFFQVDTIIFCPIVENGWDNVLLEAERAEIPVICLDKTVGGEKRTVPVYEVTFAYEDAAAGLAEVFFTQAAEEDPVIIELNGTLGSASTRRITAGFREAFAQDGRFEIRHHMYGQFMRSRGREITSGILKLNPEIDVILADNDAMTLGAVDAIAEMPANGRHPMRIFAIGGNKETLRLLQAGKISALARLDADQMAREAIRIAQKLTAGEVATSSVTIPVTVLTKEDLAYGLDESDV